MELDGVGDGMACKFIRFIGTSLVFYTIFSQVVGSQCDCDRVTRGTGPRKILIETMRTLESRSALTFIGVKMQSPRRTNLKC